MISLIQIACLTLIFGILNVASQGYGRPAYGAGGGGDLQQQQYVSRYGNARPNRYENFGGSNFNPEFHGNHQQFNHPENAFNPEAQFNPENRFNPQNRFNNENQFNNGNRFHPGNQFNAQNQPFNPEHSFARQNPESFNPEHSFARQNPETAPNNFPAENNNFPKLNNGETNFRPSISETSPSQVPVQTPEVTDIDTTGQRTFKAQNNNPTEVQASPDLATQRDPKLEQQPKIEEPQLQQTDAQALPTTQQTLTEQKPQEDLPQTKVQIPEQEAPNPDNKATTNSQQQSQSNPEQTPLKSETDTPSNAQPEAEADPSQKQQPNQPTDANPM